MNTRAQASIDNATPNDADAAYEVIMEFVPMRVNYDKGRPTQTPDQALESTRGRLFDQVRAVLKRSGLDGQSGRFRLGQHQGDARRGYFAHFYFCLKRIRDNDLAAVALRGFRFDGVECNVKTNGRVIVDNEIEQRAAQAIEREREAREEGERRAVDAEIRASDAERRTADAEARATTASRECVTIKAEMIG